MRWFDLARIAMSGMTSTLSSSRTRDWKTYSGRHSLNIGRGTLPEHRRYTKHQKLSVVMAADMVGVVAASEQAGIPESNVRYWSHKPEFAEYRARAREDLVEEVTITAHLAWQRVSEALRANTLEPRDALFAADKATTILQLLNGEATSRLEHRDITASLDDHELDALETWLHEQAAAHVD